MKMLKSYKSNERKYFQLKLNCNMNIKIIHNTNNNSYYICFYSIMYSEKTEKLRNLQDTSK